MISVAPGQKWRDRLSPLIHLSSNWISRTGVVLVTTTGILWLFLLPTMLRGIQHPYAGILTYLLLPGAFLGALLLIPLGIVLRFRKERRQGRYPAEFPQLNFQNPDLRRLLAFIGVTTVANLIIGSQLVYSAVNYMDTVTFCGQTCHTIMQPEYTAHANSPHARVECVECHIGPGASWFVRSKLSGTGQVFATIFHSYPRPIPTPVRNLRPARETCETCHWPEKFDAEILRIVPNFADDEKNTLTKTVMMVKIGGGNRGGIHGVHVGPGVRILYIPADAGRQTINWVEYNAPNGRRTVYTAPGTPADPPQAQPAREMDCIDCHNRPTHTFELPDRAVDEAMYAGAISPDLPFARKLSVELLKKPYASREEAAAQIPAAFEKYYRDPCPTVFQQTQAEVRRSAQAVLAIYDRNVFPAMKVTWGTYPNNLGHTDFPGCFRCHDDSHTSADGRKITQDCSACHSLLAVQESAPQVLKDLGLTGSTQ